MPSSNFHNRKKHTGVLLDTNLLLLILVGKFNLKFIAEFKRTSMYDRSDYENLISIIVNNNNKIFTTPNILTEVTNLTDNGILNTGGYFFEFLADFVNEFMEVVYSTRLIVKNQKDAFIRLGLTDSSIINIASENILTITSDLNLANFLSAHSKPVINYNHVKFPN